VNNGIPQQKFGQNQKNILQVCDLGESITEGDLEIFFQDFKETILMIQVNRSHRQSEFHKSSNATIFFKENETALNAKNALNLRKLRGKTIRISFFEKENSARYSNVNNLFIKNIPENVTPREFYEFFLKFGDISSAKLCEDEDGNHMGYGYLQYAEPESMQKAIENTDGKTAFGTQIEVKHFLKKNERISNSLGDNKSIYIKLVSGAKETVSEKQLQEEFKKFGKIVFFNSFKDKNLRNFYIVTYETDESANTAKNEMNGQKINNEELFVDSLMKKSDRRRYLLTKMNDNNNSLNNTFRYCNLHIRNLPLDLKEENLHEIFSKFGEIKSIKIQKYILVTKVNNVLKEYPTSKGFGFVCFVDKDAATAAKDALNEKHLPGYESAKRPLLIDFFMPKSERRQILSRVQTQFNPQSRQKQMMGNLPFNIPFNPNANFNHFMKVMKNQMPGNNHYHPKMNQVMHQQNNNMSIYTAVNNNMNQMPIVKSVDEPDMNYLNSLEDDNAKKDYLGEFIFKSIENHPMTIKRNLTIDEIGKITGMILGIEDIQEIIDISKNHKNLNNRILEALELLDQTK
jgi:RNA recognition motif-containing protein